MTTPPVITPVRTLTELRAQPVWVFYKLIQKKGKTKKDKIPFYATTGEARSGTQGAPEDRAQLVTFAEAQAASEKHRADGVGFAMQPELEITGHDMDHVTNGSGELKAESAEHVRSLPQTYMEWSPSETGLHAIFSGRSVDKKNVKKGLELFSAKGFLTFTGKPYNGNGNVRAVDRGTQGAVGKGRH